MIKNVTNQLLLSKDKIDPIITTLNPKWLYEEDKEDENVSKIKQLFP